MKAKLWLMASAAILATAVYLHHGRQSPTAGKCPLMTALSANK